MLQAYVQALYEKLHTRYLAPRKRSFNASLPIGRLPSEILAWILGFASLEHPVELPRYRRREPAPSHVKRLHVLAQVSSRWAATIKSSPELWGVVLTSYSAEETSLILRKSRDAPIDIIHREFAHKLRNDANLTELAGHLARCISMQIKSCRLAAIFGLMGPGIGWDRLNRISVEAVSVYEPERSNINLAIAAPSLRHVTLRHTTLPWETCRFTGLETLTIELITWGRTNAELKSPPLEWIFGVLQASPLLTTLKLRLTWADVKHDNSWDWSLISLPSLQCLYLGCHTFYTLRLLRYMEIPSCSSMTLRIPRELEDEPSLSSAPYMVSMHQLAISATLHLDLRGGGIIRANLSYWRKEEDRKTASPRDISLDEKVHLQTVLHVLPLSETFLHHLSINQCGQMSTSHIQTLLLPIWERTNSVTSLTLTNPAPILAYLVHLTKPIGGSDLPQWLLPNLRNLEIQWYNIHRGPVVAFVRARTTSQRAAEGDQGARVATLESIKLMACAIDKKLEGILHDIAPNLGIAWQPVNWE